MKTTVTRYDFYDAFRRMGRSDSFSYSGYKALYEYLVELEDDTGIEFELDVIEICGEYSEYATALEAAQEYGYDSEEIDCLEWLRDRTTTIEFDDGIIIQNF